MSKYLFSLLFILFFTSCHRNSSWFSPSTVAYERYTISNTSQVDSQMIQMIAPYKNQLSAKMEEIIAVNKQTLEKKYPENTLGYFVCDAMMWYARKNDFKADFSIVNNGGLRIPSIKEGNITTGQIFELMPFDNAGVVLDIDSITCVQILQTASKKGGWAVSGMSYSISKDTIPENISLFKTPKKSYKVFISDYLANGGDQMNFLKKIPQFSTNKLIRDIIIDYCKSEKNIAIKEDQRVQYAK